MERGRRSYTGSILGEEGIRGLMEWRGEEGATVCWRYSTVGEEGIGGLMEWGGEEGAILEVF
jgi:hypothetical protein